MTLTTNIALTTRTLTHRAYINDILIHAVDPADDDGIPAIQGITISKSLDSPVPVCTLEVNHIPTWVKRGQAVTVYLGYNNLDTIVFNGYVQDRSHGLESSSIHCLGKLWSAFRTVEIPERDLTGDTVEAAIEDILDDCDITGYNVNVPAFTLGTAADAKLERMPASQMLQMLMDIDCCSIWETNNGTVRIRSLERLPSGTSFKTFTSTTAATTKVIEGSDVEDPDYIRTRVIVTGATVVEGAEPDTTSRTISQTATLVDSPLVQPPLPAGTYIDMEYSNSLIDTDAKAVELAGKLLTRYARIPRTLVLEVAGDPELDLTQTLTLNIPEVHATSNFFIGGIEHRVNDSGYVTRLSLRGGDELGGTVAINPVAAFTYSVDMEVIGDALYTFATFDASGSYDPDGTTVTYAWADNQSTTPEVATKTSSIFTVRADTSAWTGTWDVTLTVTDSDSLTGTVTVSVPYSSSAADMTIPALYAAVNNNAAGTADGGQVWNTQAGSTCVSVGCKYADGVSSGVACFGYTDGSIKRTVDSCVSALTTELAAAPANGTINDIGWDVNDNNRVWAVTSTGRLLRSDDSGDTWSVYKDFGGTYPLSRVSTPSLGGVWVFGGRGDVTTSLIQWDALLTNTWTSAAIGGELATDLVGAASAITIADAVSTKYEELSIIFTGGALANDVAIFYTDKIFGDGSAWKRATGLDAGLTTGRYIVGERLTTYIHAAFNNRDTWASTDGVAYTKTADVLPANCVPWHAYYVGWAQGINGLNVHLIAVEDTSATASGIYKTADGFVTAQVLWPATGFTAWPASAKGKMVKIGAPGFTTSTTSNILIGGLLDTPTERMAAWTSGTTFTNHVFPANLDADSFFFWRVISNSVWFGFWGPSDSVDNQDDFHTVRTVDAGANWDDLYTEAAVGRVWQDIQRGADGRLWGVAIEGADRKHMEIYYNDDPEGDGSWTESKDDAGTAAAERIMHVVPHATDGNIIAVMGKSGGTSRNCITWITTNRGTTWTQNVVSDLFVSGGSFKTFDRMMLANNRIVMVGNKITSGNAVVWTSDDYGVSWTERLNVAKVGATIDYGYGPVGNGVSGILFYMWEDTDASPAEIRIYRSTDGGYNWTAIVNAALSNMPPQPATSDIYSGGLAYDSAADELYLFGAGQGNADNISQVVKIRSASGTISGWIDVSDTLNPIGAHTHYDLTVRSTHGIELIPR